MGKGSKRNLPCHCGSNKKYKKCCFLKENHNIPLNNNGVPQDVIDYFVKKESERKALEGMGIYINYVRPIIWQDKKVWAIGSRIYNNRPPDETFHQFIIDILRLTLGQEWWEAGISSPFEERHFVLKCYFKFQEWITRESVKRELVSKNVWGAKPDGWSKSLLSLAFDVCSLIHTGNLPEHLLKRLRDKNEYQGARYEITIAAIFARLGCNIKFLDDKQKLSIKHCEFIATHQATGSEVAVEVKSRHRAGIIHTPGAVEEEKLLKGDVQRLVNRALKQNPGDKPFIIFIDLNSPQTPDKDMQDKQWFKDIENMISKYGTPTKEKPDPFNGIFFTNYSYHYQTEEEAKEGEFLQIIPFCPKFSLPNDKFLSMLNSSLKYYGRVPNFDVEEK